MIIHGDSLDVLKTLDNESVDLLCTDPPYGYSFMGKAWDKALPDIGIFRECLRVLKPGAFAFVMSAPRSDVCSRMAILLEDAGFVISFTPIYWTYASGFPKAMNIGKMVDKREGVERKVVGSGKGRTGAAVKGHDDIHGDDAYEWPGEFNITKGSSPLEGSYGGFQPKPAVEVIIVAMKPLSEKTYVDQALKNGKGITWLDDVRVPTTENISVHDAPTGTFAGGEQDRGSIKNYREQNAGRFPANLLVSDDVLNDGTITKSTGGKSVPGFGDNVYGQYEKQLGTNSGGLGDIGGYSHFFSLDAWAQTLPFLAVPKASKGEKNRGLETQPSSNPRPIGVAFNKDEPNGFKDSIKRANHHPTVKPLKLMSYLITLGSRPGDTVLDPFAGSGTTCVAAKELGREFIGVERESEYVEIANARLEAVMPTLL